MSTITPNNRDAKRNILILIVVQALIGSLISTHFILAGLAGKLISGNLALATIPVSATVVGSMLAAPILARFMAHYGRIYGFLVATFIAVIGALIIAYALSRSDFWLMAFGALLIGFYQSAQGMFRFAATDMATPDFKPRAVSYTLIGGIAAAIIGPGIVRGFSEPDMALPYIIMAVISFVASGLYLLLVLPHEKPNKSVIYAPLAPIFRDRQVIGAMIVSIGAYATMNLMMTSTPLAVEGCGYNRADNANIVSAHVLAMFLPSFVTGHIMKWYGVRPVMAVGVIILMLSSFVALAGVELSNFYVALILLGIGWNFAFIGGTALLTRAVEDPVMAKRVQGVNDTIMWSMVALASLSSGFLMNGVGDGAETGWQNVNYAMLPVLIIALMAALVLVRDRK